MDAEIANEDVVYPLLATNLHAQKTFVERKQNSFVKDKQKPFNNIDILNNNQEQTSFDEIISSTKGFKMALLNINSLTKHFNEIEIFLSKQPLDVLAINETKLDKRSSDESIKIPGYICVRKDRDRHGGGVCMYLRESLNFTRKTCYEDSNLEMISIELKSSNSSPFLLTTWYRPPKQPINNLENFEMFLRHIDQAYKEYYILGDININLLNDHPEPNSSRLKEILCEYQLSQIIKQPTRVTPTSRSLIDLFITSDKEMISLCGVYPLTISDHYLIYGIRKSSLKHGEPKFIITRNVKNFSEEQFVSDIQHAQWPDISTYTNVNEAWECWKTIFTGVLEKHAPT